MFYHWFRPSAVERAAPSGLLHTQFLDPLAKGGQPCTLAIHFTNVTRFLMSKFGLNQRIRTVFVTFYDLFFFQTRDCISE